MLFRFDHRQSAVRCKSATLDADPAWRAFLELVHRGPVLSYDRLARGYRGETLAAPHSYDLHHHHPCTHLLATAHEHCDMVPDRRNSRGRGLGVDLRGLAGRTPSQADRDAKPVSDLPAPFGKRRPADRQIGRAHV